MTRTLYVPNPGFEAEFLSSDEALEAVRPATEKIGTLAQSIAAENTGDLAGGIRADFGFVDGKATGRVNSHDFKGAWLEYGTSRSDPGGRAQPYLRPAAESILGPLTGGRR